MVSAWACDSALVFGQVAVGDKSNEITAIPALLALADLRDGGVPPGGNDCGGACRTQSVSVFWHWTRSRSYRSDRAGRVRSGRAGAAL